MRIFVVVVAACLTPGEQLTSTAFDGLTKRMI